MLWRLLAGEEEEEEVFTNTGCCSGPGNRLFVLDNDLDAAMTWKPARDKEKYGVGE